MRINNLSELFTQLGQNFRNHRVQLIGILEFLLFFLLEHHLQTTALLVIHDHPLLLNQDHLKFVEDGLLAIWEVLISYLSLKGDGLEGIVYVFWCSHMKPISRFNGVVQINLLFIVYEFIYQVQVWYFKMLLVIILIIYVLPANVNELIFTIQHLLQINLLTIYAFKHVNDCFVEWLGQCVTYPSLLDDIKQAFLQFEFILLKVDFLFINKLQIIHQKF